MKLTVSSRKELKKSDTKRIRREGNIPAILYGLGHDNELVMVNGEEMRTHLRNMKSGLLATTVFELTDGKKARKAIVKDIHYHPVSYAILHMDFALVADDRAVTVNVPLQITGTGDCVGIKLGGFLRQVIRSLKVECLPKHIPQEFTLDVRELNLNEAKRLSDIAIPSNVRPMARMNEVAVVIAKKV
ncbi:MAG TPA: 50S ribosomal protein L25 [Chlamydiales bacterium]|jgi:large subunit ribosomal protein L25